MATNEHIAKGRSALGWAAIGFAFYGAVMSGAIALLHRGGLPAVFASRATDGILAAALFAATLVTGLGLRNVPVTPRSFRNLLIWNGVGLTVFALVIGGLRAFAGGAALKALGVSATIALWVGLVLFFLAVVGLLHVAAARTRTHLLSAEQRETILDRVRALSYSLLAVAAMGLTLVVLSLAGPHGPLSPLIALVCVIVLLAIRATLSLATRPLLDELSKTVGRETGSGAFYLIVLVGGGWSILAQLGFVPAPASLDWLTLFTVALFTASFVAAGRRGLLKPS